MKVNLYRKASKHTVIKSYPIEWYPIFLQHICYKYILLDSCVDSISIDICFCQKSLIRNSRLKIAVRIRLIWKNKPRDRLDNLSPLIRESSLGGVHKRRAPNFYPFSLISKRLQLINAPRIVVYFFITPSP